jgi:hypothetical protein
VFRKPACRAASDELHQAALNQLGETGRAAKRGRLATNVLDAFLKANLAELEYVCLTQGGVP